MGDFVEAGKNQGDGTRKLSIAFVTAVALHAALLIPFYTSRIQIISSTPMVVDLEASAIDTGTGMDVVPASQTPAAGSAAPSVPPGTAVAAASSQSASQSDFVIPTPKTAVDPGAAPAAGTSSFREEGGRTGVTVPPKAPDVQPKPPLTSSSSGSSASTPPSKGQGVLVQGQNTTGGSLDLGSLDKALATKGSGAAAGSGTAAGSGAASAAGSAASSGSGKAGGGSGIQWSNPSVKRDPLFQLNPKIPAWVGAQGLSLTVTVSFTVSPEGTVSSPKVEKSSGYADVNAAVLEAVRLWRFSEDSSSPPVVGILTYVISVH